MRVLLCAVPCRTGRVQANQLVAVNISFVLQRLAPRNAPTILSRTLPPYRARRLGIRRFVSGVLEEKGDNAVSGYSRFRPAASGDSNVLVLPEILHHS